MKIITYYECEVCGERFKYEENCTAHELRHSLENLFASGAKFYDLNGDLITIDSLESEENFTDIVYGIVCPSAKAADDVQEFWNKVGYVAPFDEIDNMTAMPYRVMYDEDTCAWFNVDEALTRIKKQFGEE